MSEADAVGPKRPLKLAFVAPFSLFDSSSGAVQSIRTMLEQLALRGVDCRAITGACFDRAPAGGAATLLVQRGLGLGGAIRPTNIPLWTGSSEGVSYRVVQNPTWHREAVTALEEMNLRDAFLHFLRDYRPDIVLTFGGFLLDMEIQRCAREVGARIAFYLANPSYRRADTFANVDLILANSAATAEHYARAMQLRSHVVGLFVDTAPVLAAPLSPGFVTLINPVAEKGVALFLRLVERAAREVPDMRFLVVESRGTLLEALHKLGLPESLMAQVTVLPRQDRMARVYAQTRVLLMPSFWFEAAGRVLIEANANGIPVLATDRGGIPETLGGAGRLLPVPERCTRDHWSLPTQEEAQPWWDELLRLWRDPAHHAALSQQALAVAAGQSVAAKAARLEALLRAALA